MSAPSIAFEQVRLELGGVAIYDELSFSVRPSEFVCLLGPSGCGKSTALRLIAGLAAPTAGTVQIPRHDNGARPGHAIGFVFQEPTLMPWASVADNIYLPLRLEGPVTTAEAEQPLRPHDVDHGEQVQGERHHP